ncbi:MAG TPA: UxaA family hydrolase [Firmicutes bacterium]|jgi:altronate dehydratase large subunit|nr:UxaA family hydrolase [Bacillota bacterium]
MEFMGYLRPDGQVGIRNYVLILPSVVCANRVAEQIAEAVPGAVALPHPAGCAQVGADFEQTKRTLVGFGTNPNVGAVLVVGLGCEGLQPDELVAAIKPSGKWVEGIVIQEEGGTPATVRRGTQIAIEMSSELSQMKREPFPLSELILATECGGSDSTSGLAANPALGVASDLLVEAGGTVILSETTELMGAEHVLAKRGCDAATGKELVDIVNKMEEDILRMGVDLRGSQPSPGNIAGGLTTIEEKSLGCIYKAGTTPINEVLAFAQRPSKKGLVVMDTPGYDIPSVTGMIAGGAQIVVFTTGRGTPTGAPIAPVIKVTGNPETWEKMRENLDINAGVILQGKATKEDVGKEILAEVIKVANGKQTRAEILGHREFAIWRVGPTV